MYICIYMHNIMYGEKNFFFHTLLDTNLFHEYSHDSYECVLIHDNGTCRNDWFDYGDRGGVDRVGFVEAFRAGPLRPH